jgi:hypothetical protein
VSHKPTPYHVGPYYKSDVESGSGRVAECGITRGPQACEDAAFIVRACNAHYDLLAACKEALKGFDKNEQCLKVPRMLRNAITQAEITP